MTAFDSEVYQAKHLLWEDPHLQAQGPYLIFCRSTYPESLQKLNRTMIYSTSVPDRSG